MKNLTPLQRRLMPALRYTVPRAPQGIQWGQDGLFTPQAQEAIQESINAIFARHRTVGGTVGLIHRGQLAGVFPYGLARIEDKVSADAATLYRVASVSKLVYTFGVLSLVEEGVLDLDADIGTYLGYPVRSPHFPQVSITLRQLMTHTAGLLDQPQYDGPGIEGKMTLKEMLSPPNNGVNFAQHRPGTVFCYANFGAGIVGSVVEAVTGNPFDDTMQGRVFTPLGLTASYAPPRMLPHAHRLARGYAVGLRRPPALAYDAPKLAQAPGPVADPERNFMCTPGRLLIDMSGLSVLLRLLASDGEVDGVRVLSPDSMALMRSLQDGVGSVTGICGRGLNVAFAQDLFAPGLMIGHQGEAYGMNSQLWVDPATGDGVVMATSGTLLYRLGRIIHCGWEVVSFGMKVLRAG